MGREIFSAMPVTRNDLIWALHSSWLNITVQYLHNLYKSHQKSKGGYWGTGLLHKYKKVFWQKGQYLNMSHLS